MDITFVVLGAVVIIAFGVVVCMVTIRRDKGPI
jgi:hypothetical protein